MMCFSRNVVGAECNREGKSECTERWFVFLWALWTTGKIYNTSLFLYESNHAMTCCYLSFITHNLRLFIALCLNNVINYVHSLFPFFPQTSLQLADFYRTLPPPAVNLWYCV